MRRLRMKSWFPGWRAVLRLSLLAGMGLAASVGWSQTSFYSPQIISGQWGGVTNDNTGVIPDLGGPSHGGFPPQHTLWYQWTAPESGEVTLDTLGSVDAGGTNLDTVLAVYIGPNISHLSKSPPMTTIIRSPIDRNDQTYGQTPAIIPSSRLSVAAVRSERSAVQRDRGDNLLHCGGQHGGEGVFATG